MGYQCPVCSVPQADATHLADHLGFTAIIHDDDEHGAWLDEYVDGWGSMSRAELREVVVEFAEDADYPQVFEDTVHEAGEHQHDTERSGKLFEDEYGHDHDHAHGGQHRPAGVSGLDGLDAEGRAVVEEAQELTERRRRRRDAETGGSAPGQGEEGTAQPDATDDADGETDGS